MNRLPNTSDSDPTSNRQQYEINRSHFIFQIGNVYYSQLMIFSVSLLRNNVHIADA